MRMIRQKLRAETAITPEPGFPVMGRQHYLTYLKALHGRLNPKVYFEIGTESGASLSFASCTSIAVDPQFQLQSDVSRNKPELHQFQGTSDDFFASNLLKRLGLAIDLAFLDGMHLFEYLLRDFINTERHMAPDGMITMHDCVPFNHLVAEREWDRAKTKSWTGDVWKLVPILREYRPDLTVEVLDLAPTGLVCVTNLSPENTVLAEQYDKIVARYLEVSIDDFGQDAFDKAIALQSAPGESEPLVVAPNVRPQAIFSAWERPENPAARSLNIAIKTAVPNPRSKSRWGDYHFARSLADSFLRAGHSVKIDSVKEWYRASAGTDLDLVLFGSENFARQENIPMLGWVIYPGRTKDDLVGAFDGADHMFFASRSALSEYSNECPDKSASCLMQGFDSTVMYAGDAPGGDGAVFVGNNHFGDQGERPVVQMALQSGTRLAIWGMGWAKHQAAQFLQGRYVENDKLGQLYRSASVVLCDHMPLMRETGYLSNRIYDALACGTPVICDGIADLDPAFSAFVHPCKDAQEFAAAIDAITASADKSWPARQKLAQTLKREHSFDVRAAQIIEKARELSLL